MPELFEPPVRVAIAIRTVPVYPSIAKMLGFTCSEMLSCETVVVHANHLCCSH